MRGTRRAAMLSWTTVRITDLILSAFDFAAENRRYAYQFATDPDSRAKAQKFIQRALELLSPLLIALTAFTASAAIPRPIEPSANIQRNPLPSEEIKVRLQSVASSFSVSGIGLRFPGSPERKAGLYQALQVSWERDSSGLFAWTIKDRDSSAVVQKFKARQLEVVGSHLRINLKPVAGRLTLIPKAGADVRTEVVATLDLEEYLRGVLPAEMPKDWPLEALKAQAIASRTYALYRKRARERSGASHHVESTVMDQVYRSLDSDLGAAHENIQRAIRETEGMILVSTRDMTSPLAAYFHSDCGGHTEDARVVWGEASAGTAACPYSSQSEWKTEFTLSEIESRVSGRLKRAQSNSTLMGLEPLGRTSSGRVENIRLVWSDGEEALMPAHMFRMALGHDRVRSTNFRFTTVGENRIQIIGQGSGHGVGLCQWGARHLALRGKSFREILKHYYPNSVLVTPTTMTTASLN